jgi:hypothetical protein
MQKCIFLHKIDSMTMDNFFGCRKFLFSLLFGTGVLIAQAQEPNLQQSTEAKFKLQYKVDLFQVRAWSWMKTHPEYNAFLVSKMNRNPQYNSESSEVQPTTSGKGGDGITPKIQK